MDVKIKLDDDFVCGRYSNGKIFLNDGIIVDGYIGDIYDLSGNKITMQDQELSLNDLISILIGDNI